MRFLSVADRELRSAARQKATYLLRWRTAALFLAVLVWLFWAFDGFKNRRAAPQVFDVFSVLTFLYCLLIGTARTADCLSAERRDGTLGLLFLTNLNSAEIIAGKLCSTALASVYGLMAIFPMLALPLLLGGITFEHFARTVVALLNGILFALAAGFLASVVCLRQFIAVAFALGLVISVGGGVMLASAAASAYGPTRSLANGVAVFSPLYTLIVADGGRPFGPNRFWLSAGIVAALSLGWLALTTLLLAVTWRDRPKSVRARPRFRIWPRANQGSAARRLALRRRLLEINPLFWLGARQLVSAPVFMAITVILVAIAVFVAAPFFGRVMRAGTFSPVVGHLFAWLWTGLAIHALVLYYGAMSASQRLAEDKQTGALELILSTPTTERTLSRGLWLAYARKMMFPALVAALAHVFFIWLCLAVAVLDPPGNLPPHATVGEIFWSALLDRPLRGHMIEWQFGFLLRSGLLALLLFMMTWVTLGWVARWLGLRMKHPGFAPLVSLALVFIPPILLFSLACYLAEKLHFTRLPARQFLSMMMWLTFGIGVGHCLLVSAWAASRLRHSLRAVAMSRYQPLPAWRWRLPSRRVVWRFAVTTVLLVGTVTAIVTGYFGYHNHRSRRAWRTFQTGLAQSGDSLDLARLLPNPVPDDANFARSPAFRALLAKTNNPAKGLFQRLQSFDLQPGGNVVNFGMMEWTRQSPSSLRAFLNLIEQKSQGGFSTNRKDEASAILRDLQSQSGRLRAVADAAARLPAFQVSTNRDPSAVFHSPRDPVTTLERLHLLFQVRACAALAAGQNADAAEDFLTGLRLARLARQVPDVHSTLRLQTLLARSLQPLWEGLGDHAWTGPQLATFQNELAGFNLLADFTNAVRRVVLAHIETWRAIPDKTDGDRAIPSPDGGYQFERAWELQPRAWWFDCCIQLHHAGQNVLEKVDVAGGRMQSAMNWGDLNDLPLDQSSSQLLLQWVWGVNPGLVSFAQTSVNQAIVACALERFRLTNGVYPETLDALVPALLPRIPNDAVSGRPIIYQRGEDGSYMLRGVGPNGVDDRKSKTSDDWLWTYSTNTPAVKQ
jgi:hypothetical protein